MKTIILCAILLIGCTSVAETKLESCLNAQIEIYGDLCGESTAYYDEMSADEAHFEGVKCAVQAIRVCMESTTYKIGKVK